MKLRSVLDTILSTCLFILFLQLMALGCVGCGPQVEFSSIPMIDPQLEPYVQRFRDTYNIDVRFQVNFGPMDTPEHVGICTSWSNGARRVTIKKEFFDVANDAQREVLIFHELGHCRLGKNHDQGTTVFVGISGLWPLSIMRDHVFDQEEAAMYLMHRDFYVQQL